MGIFDDAIRQHLELKRQRGATESELKQLEDEAFGPPGRPGEPDFPDSEGSGNGVAADAAVSEPPLAPAATPEIPPESSASEQPVLERPPEAAEPVAEEEAPEATPESEELTTVYDQRTEREPELDQLEMEPRPAEPEAGEPEPDEDRDEADQLVEPLEPGGSAVADAPVESLDTVEHALPEEATEPEESAAEEPRVEPDAEPAPEQEAGAEDEEEEDVLADTPDFLRDAPEDDELWFEQGKPKDFDF